MQPIGRLALRDEAGMWNAYYAQQGTMEGAIFLGSLRMDIAENSDRKKQFIDLMREAVGDIIEQVTGTRPSWPDPPHKAPKSERKKKVIQQAATELTKLLTDEGKLIEGGFAAFVHVLHLPETQIEPSRLAFMAGAEHLFASVMNVLDPGEEPTETDLRRMDQIQEELNRWREVLAQRSRGGATQ